MFIKFVLPRDLYRYGKSLAEVTQGMNQWVTLTVDMDSEKNWPFSVGLQNVGDLIYVAKLMMLNNYKERSYENR